RLIRRGHPFGFCLRDVIHGSLLFGPAEGYRNLPTLSLRGGRRPTKQSRASRAALDCFVAPAALLAMTLNPCAIFAPSAGMRARGIRADPKIRTRRRFVAKSHFTHNQDAIRLYYLILWGDPISQRHGKGGTS